MATDNGTRVCVVDNCDRASSGRYCSAHQQRVTKHGDPMAHVPIQARARNAGEVCVVDSCARPRKNGPTGMCQAHYHRAWRGSDVDSPIRSGRKAPLPVENLADGRRRCTECRRVFVVADGFHRDARGPGGYRKTCKTCRVRRETERYRANPDAAAAKMRAFRKANPEHVRAREAGYYLKHRDARVEAAVEAVHRRRALIAGVRRDRGITRASLRRLDGDDCCYCGRAMVFSSMKAGSRLDAHATIEHVVAIARGGSHTWDNCALACWRCNITKGARDDEWNVRDGHRLSSCRTEMGA